MQCSCGIVPLVVATIYLIVDVTILNIGICIEVFCQTIIGFKVYVTIVLGTFVTVVFVSSIESTDVVLYPKNLTEVVALVTVERSAQRGCNLVALIV